MDTMQMNQESEDISRKNQEFWNKWYMQFNPQAQLANTPTSAPGYNDAAKRTQDYASQQMASGGPTSVDVGGMNRNIQNQAQMKTRSSDLNSFLRDFDENRGRAQNLGTMNFNRMGEVAQANRGINRLPMDRFNRQLKTNADIQRMWDAYRADQDPMGNIVGSAVGGFAGQLGADLFGRKKKGIPTPEEYNLQMPPDRRNSYGPLF